MIALIIILLHSDIFNSFFEPKQVDQRSLLNPRWKSRVVAILIVMMRLKERREIQEKSQLISLFQKVGH